MVTLAGIFPPTQPPERIGPVAAAADAAGLEQLWVWEDCFAESGIATATAMLAVTSRVTVGIGLLPVPLRNVALTAMELATVSRLFPGRLVAGVGHGVLDWMGQAGARVESPMTLLREYTAALYALLHGETVTTRGRYVNLDAVAEIQNCGNGEYMVILRTGKELPLGRTYRERLDSLVGSPK